MKLKSIDSYIFIILLFISCRKENAGDCFKPNGKIVSETRYPGAFSEIEMNDKIEVTIYKGTDYQVEVVAGKNIVKNIETEVTDGILKIQNGNKCNFVRGYKKKVKVNITVPYVRHVLNNGVGTLYFDENYYQDTLYVNAESSGDTYINGTYKCIRAETNGNGDMYISGATNALQVFTNGTNFVKAGNLKVYDHVFIETLSKGDCFFNGKQLKRFEYNIRGEGNIYYKGKPSIIKSYCDGTEKGRAIEED